MKHFILTAMLAGGLYAAPAQIQNFSVGQTAPNFTVTDIHGVSHSLYNYTAAGKYVILDFYAYWCGPCCSTAPIIKDFYLKYGCNAGDVVVLGLEGDGTTAQTEDFETNCVNVPHTYPCASGLDGSADPVHVTYGPAAYPTVCLINPSNKFVNLDIWPISNVASIEAAFPAGSIDPMTCLVTGLEDILADHNVAVYPSPADQNVTLALNLGQHADVSYTITNAMGQTVASQKLGMLSTLNQTIDVSNMANGAYILQVVANGGQSKTTRQFMVAH